MALFFVVALDLIERRRRIRTIEGLQVRAVLGGVATQAEACRVDDRTHHAVVGGLMVAVMVLGLVIYGGGGRPRSSYFQFWG